MPLHGQEHLWLNSLYIALHPKPLAVDGSMGNTGSASLYKRGCAPTLIPNLNSTGQCSISDGEARPDIFQEVRDWISLHEGTAAIKTFYASTCYCQGNQCNHVIPPEPPTTQMPTTTTPITTSGKETTAPTRQMSKSTTPITTSGKETTAKPCTDNSPLESNACTTCSCTTGGKFACKFDVICGKNVNFHINHISTLFFPFMLQPFVCSLTQPTVLVQEVTYTLSGKYEDISGLETEFANALKQALIQSSSSLVETVFLDFEFSAGSIIVRQNIESGQFSFMFQGKTYTAIDKSFEMSSSYQFGMESIKPNDSMSVTLIVIIVVLAAILSVIIIITVVNKLRKRRKYGMEDTVLLRLSRNPSIASKSRVEFENPVYG
ncbi:hypothetical protein BSL78_28102 [Apostichopus japonicus]|uniref:Uncharacterized protein n=1 Tax=Stichopus japonicus TaxID=307972 RepID=A0A2G8JH27_STIJA|nr:hypothetical protein BSL78_28102 [Apostichopus japonicus]